MIRSLIILLITVFLVGCAGTTKEGGGQPYIYNIKAGSKFVLNKDISIPKRSAHVYLQDGKIVKYSDMDEYAPNCRLEVKTRGEQTIEPGTFSVSKVNQQNIVMTRGAINYVVTFELQASDPNIHSLTCGAVGSTTDTFITVPEMQKALGNYFDTPTL